MFVVVVVRAFRLANQTKMIFKICYDVIYIDKSVVATLANIVEPNRLTYVGKENLACGSQIAEQSNVFYIYQTYIFVERGKTVCGKRSKHAFKFFPIYYSLKFLFPI